MGRVNLGVAFDSTPRILVDQTQVLGSTGSTYTVHGSIGSSAQPFRVVLAWTDVPGATSGSAYVNNLDLEVTVNGTLYRGNVFSGDHSISGGSADSRNNLESVFLPAGASGSFSVSVRATNIAGDGVPGNADSTDQDFALVVYNGNAGAPTPDFSLSASPASRSVSVGGTATFAVTDAALNGFAGSVTLTATPPISGVSYAFSTNPVAPNGSSTLTVTTTAAAPIGTQTITLTGVSGSLTHTTGVDLTIKSAGSSSNPVKTYSAAPNLPIPDSNATGVTSTISVSDGLTITSISVSPNITHTYQGDLQVTLTGPDGTSAILHNQTGGATDNVITTYAIATTPNQALTAFNGKNTAGAWKLKVADLATADTGTFNSWKITFNGEQTATPALPIPDNNATGVTSTLNFAQSGTVASVKVRVNITHTYQGDLVVTLIAPDNTSVILHNQTGAGTDNITTEYPDLTVSNQTLNALSGKTVTGAWKLKVQDLAAQDIGTLNSWTLSFTVP
jgi:subtilisin-like proprotein convertase family protein